MKKPKRKSSPLKLVDTEELCKDLVRMAAFLEDKRVQTQIYKAVRQLQLLDRLAVEAGIMPADEDNKC